MDDLAVSVPIVALASSTRFAAGGVLSFPSVQSRMVLGCHDGIGVVVLGGVEHELRPGLLYLLPWGHAITYRADRDDPFYVYGMHVIPAHRVGARIELSVAHDPRSHLYGSADRADRADGADGADGSGTPHSSVIATHEAERPGLTRLVQYAIAVFAGEPTDEQARALGSLAIVELARAPHVDVRANPAVPAELRRLLHWIDANLAGPIALRDLTRADGRGTSTLNRLFRDHLGRSPMDWVLHVRIVRACSLLSSTHLGVAQIARSVGFDDPYYFSRVFKSRTGLSPRDWRHQRQI